MPKRVDREARRVELALALRQVMAVKGVEGASLRNVAAQTGVSMGLVQHYFEDREEMLVFTLDELSRRLARRAFVRAQAARRSGGSPAALRAVILQLLPLDPERRAEALAGAAFVGRSGVSPAVATALRRASENLTQLIASEISRGREAGELPADVVPERDARLLLSFARGLAFESLSGQSRRQAVAAQVDDVLARILGLAQPQGRGASRRDASR
jgi:TetR/AcrR family transcriptional regulator, transcriptional repressor of bet genes